MNEVWKDVEGYVGIYQVSNLGNVKSLGRWETNKAGKTRWRKGVILKQRLTSAGYNTVHLRDRANGLESWPSVHRLVAIAFIPNVENKPTVNHINGVKTDNSSNNLEWATQQEQTKHAFNNNLMFVRGNTLYNEEFKEEVKEYYDKNNISIAKLAKHFGMSSTTASRIVKGLYGDPRKTPKHIRAKAIWLREQGFTLHKIGEICGVDFSTVHNWTPSLVEALERGLRNA